MYSKIISLITIFSIVNGAIAEFSYVDSIAIGFKNCLHIGDKGMIFAYHPSVSIGNMTKINGLVNSTQFGLVVGNKFSHQLPINEKNKKRIGQVLKYDTYYVMSSFMRRYDVSETPKYLGKSLVNQIGKPALFVTTKETLDELAQTETGKKFIQYIPEGYRDGVVEHGNFLIAGAFTELVGTPINGHNEDLRSNAKRIGIVALNYTISHVAEPTINKGCGWVAEKLVGPGEGWTKSALCVAANFGMVAVVGNQTAKL